MSAIQKEPQSEVVMKAFRNAVNFMGLSQAQGARLLGKTRATLERKPGFAHHSIEFELQVLFIRLYRSLYAIMGGDQSAMRHWFNTDNTHLHGAPVELIKRVSGLVETNQYLDAMRGKI
jgi:hypothetical protein